MNIQGEKSDHSVYVFDLDGTLYDQPRLRMIMAFRLVCYYLFHPFAIRQLYILKYFRKVKDGMSGAAGEDEIINRVASDCRTDPGSVRMIVKKWIYDDPLSVIAKTKDKKLADHIASLRKSGKKVIILSDYPTEDKLEALCIEADGQYYTLGERIGAPKPSPKGLLAIVEDLGVSPEDMILIGDRMEKDGECAKAAGVEYIILPRHVRKRKYS